MAVLVTHNRLAKLQNGLARLLESSSEQLGAVIVIDNASSDGTADWLAQVRDPRLTVRRLETNSGGAGGFAAGMALAAQRFDPDWMLLLDDDAWPAPDALEIFHASDPERWDALAAAVYYPDGRICEMNRPSRNPFRSVRLFLRTLFLGRNGFHIALDEYASPERRQIHVTSFVGFFVSRAGVALAGLPDAGLFLYGDDSIYTLTLSSRGGRIAFAPDIRFEHDCTTFGAGRERRFSPLWKAYYYHRNLLILYRRAAGVLFWPALLLILARWLAGTADHGGARMTYLALLSRAVRDGIAGRTDVAHETVLAWADQSGG